MIITIIDYGAGNLCSVVNAVSKLGYQSRITDKPEELNKAQAVILPGVGAAGDTMANLKKFGLVNPIHKIITDGRPFLGICIGLQVLFSGTDEGGRHECLGILPGWVKRLPQGLKIPHMGWNQVKQIIPHPLFDGIPDQTNFYFVHSYYVEPDDRSLVAAETEYGTRICSIIGRNNLMATQFHPEKSGEYGLKIYENFIRLALRES